MTAPGSVMRAFLTPLPLTSMIFIANCAVAESNVKGVVVSRLETNAKSSATNNGILTLVVVQLAMLMMLERKAELVDVGLAETQAKGSVLTPASTIGLVPVLLTAVPEPEAACTFTDSITLFTLDIDHALESELELTNATVLKVNVTPPSTSFTLLLPPVVPGTTETPEPGWHPSLPQVASAGGTSLLLPQLRVASNAKIAHFFIISPRNSL